MPASRPLLLLPLALAAAPLAAQSMGQTLGYQWLTAVRDQNATKINEISAKRSQLNSAVLDYQSGGEGAIHIAVKQGNIEYLNFMLGLGANPNLLSERDGETPLGLAVLGESQDIVTLLLAGKARIDQPNRAGETALVKAVRFHRLEMVQLLLKRGADADKADYTGKSARMYAAQDTRSPQITKALADAPRRTARPVAGPKLN